MGRDHQGLQFLPDLLREVAHDLRSGSSEHLIDLRPRQGPVGRIFPILYSCLPETLVLSSTHSGVHTQVHTQEHTQELPCRFQWRGVDGDGQPHTNAAQSWKPPAHWQ